MPHCQIRHTIISFHKIITVGIRLKMTRIKIERQSDAVDQDFSNGHIYICRDCFQTYIPPLLRPFTLSNLHCTAERVLFIERKLFSAGFLQFN